MKNLLWPAIVIAGLSPVALCAEQDDAIAAGDTVEVTATREPELVDKVPASITIITGEELRLRGANDLRTALSLVSGVEGTPGGDSGPAGTVPALWGLREVDAFLLVVDGVPWGGAFNPATPSVDLNGVERIEVLRGAAPTVFGATSFVGVIHVIHFAAGATPSYADVSGGSYGSYGLRGGGDLPTLGPYQQSVTANIEKRGYAEDRTDFERYHVLYRGAGIVGSANFHVDADVSILPQDPAGNLLLRDGTTVHNELPIDVNYNPAGAKIDQQRYYLSLGLDGSNSAGDWSLKLAATRTLNDLLRGFLRGNAFADPPDAGVGDGLQADGYSQGVGVTDIYADAHLTTEPSEHLKVMYGVDYLYGYGEEDAINFGYCINVNGQEYSCDGAHHADEIVSSDDQRGFAGAYAQADWQATDSVDVLAGVRLNYTRETADGLAIDNTGPAPVVSFQRSDERTTTRLSGTLGASWRSWTDGKNALTWYADYRNSFKPLAIDFGPEAEVDVLEPETGVSYEIGAKSQLLNGRLDIDTSVFRMDFQSGLTYAQDVNGQFGRTNGGESRFQGFEIESRFQLMRGWQLRANYANHDSRFVNLTGADGIDVSGNRVEMSPRQLGAFGLLYEAPVGLSGTVVVNYVSPRELNATNTVQVGGYTTLDASLRYTVNRYQFQLNGYNLTDARDPVAASELNESVTVTGTAGYYRLPSRTVVLSVRHAW